MKVSKPRTASLTQSRLKELLLYDPDTGMFTRKVPVPGYLAGSIAGSVSQRGYITIVVDDVSHKAHRLAWLYMKGKHPSKYIDHINGVLSDNRFSNLREATPTNNQQNAVLRKDSTSGIKNVKWYKQLKKWVVEIKVNKKSVHIGYFKNIEDAEQAARLAREKYHGKFANHG